MHICLFWPNLSTKAECDKKWTFKWNLTGLNKRAIFSKTGFYAKVYKISLTYY